MKLLYVIHQFYPEFQSGTEKFLLNLASAMQRDGHSTKIVTYTLSDPESRTQPNSKLYRKDYVYQSLPVISFRHIDYPDDVHISCSDSDVYGFAKELLKENPCDLLHIAHPMRVFPFARAAMDLKIPYVFTLTDFWLMCPKTLLQSSSESLCTGPEGGRACTELCPELGPDFIQDRLNAAEKVLSCAGAVVSPSRFLAAMFKKELPVLNPRVIPHGIDLRSLRSTPRHYRNNDQVIFAYCGTISPHKGIHLLMKSFLKLDPCNGRLKLYGAYSHYREYYNYLREIAGGDPRVEFCGPFPNDQAGKILSGIDVMVLPSLCYESYSLVLHEALASNIPVLASNTGGLAEKITDSVNGYTFRLGDENDLMQKLKQILDTPEILNTLKKNIAEILPLTVEEEAYLYDRIYRKVLNKSGQQAPE